MGVSSTRVGDHRGSARTVQYLSKNHMMVGGLRSARSGALPHLAVFAAESPVLCLPSLSSLLSLPSLDHFSLYLVSTCDFGLAVVCLSRCGSIPPRPLSSPYRIPPPPPRELGLASCFKFQASSFLDLNIPLSSSPSPRRALSNTWSLSAGTLSSSHLPSLRPPSVWCERRERFYRLSPLSSLPPAPTCARASWLPPLTLSPNTCLPHRIIPSLHLPPCVCVCVCKRRELDLTLPLPSLSPRAGEAHVLYRTCVI